MRVQWEVKILRARGVGEARRRRGVLVQRVSHRVEAAVESLAGARQVRHAGVGLTTRQREGRSARRERGKTTGVGVQRRLTLHIISYSGKKGLGVVLRPIERARRHEEGREQPWGGIVPIWSSGRTVGAMRLNVTARNEVVVEPRSSISSKLIIVIASSKGTRDRTIPTDKRRRRRACKSLGRISTELAFGADGIDSGLDGNLLSYRFMGIKNSYSSGSTPQTKYKWYKR